MEDYQLPKGTEPCWTTCRAEVNVRYVQYGKIIVSPSSAVSAAPLLLRPAPAVCASAVFLPRSRHHLGLDLCCCHLSLTPAFVTLRVSININCVLLFIILCHCSSSNLKLSSLPVNLGMRIEFSFLEQCELYQQVTETNDLH